MTHEDVTKQLTDCSLLKPKTLIIDDLQCKYLIRSVLRGKNILFLGPSRSGKTTAAKSVAEIFSETKTEIVDENQLNNLRVDPTIKIEKIEEM